MRRKVTSAVIARPVDEVFDWVTTPARWPQVSPVTFAIEVAEPGRPLRVGDVFREHVRIRAWRGHFDWTVELLERPSRCVLTGISSGEGFVSRLAGHDAVRMELTCSGDGDRTQFTRELSYHVGIAEAVGDLLGFGEAVDAASDVTMTTMVSMLENPLLRGPRPDAADEQWLHEADPLADEAVASLVLPSGDVSALERFIAGLYRGAPHSEDLPEPMRRFFGITSTLPPWTCKPRLDAASDVFLDWGVLAVGAHICASLPETYVMPRVARLLNLTRQLDADPTHADRRIWFTVRMCLDVLARNGLGPRGEGLLAVQRLRLIHADGAPLRATPPGDSASLGEACLDRALGHAKTGNRSATGAAAHAAHVLSCRRSLAADPGRRADSVSARVVHPSLERRRRAARDSSGAPAARCRGRGADVRDDQEPLCAGHLGKRSRPRARAGVVLDEPLPGARAQRGARSDAVRDLAAHLARDRGDERSRCAAGRSRHRRRAR